MKINYYALHYHMKQCGIRTVIEDMLQSMSNDPDINLNLIYSSNRRVYVPNNSKIKVIDIPEVAYDDMFFKSQDALMKKAAILKDKIRDNLDLSRPCVLQCHNVNIFKSSYLGAALMLLADELKYKDFTFVMHLHDFAEEKREARMNIMMNCTGKKDRKFGAKIAFPIGQNVIYFTINSRDLRLLRKVGIPSSRIFLYPNAIDTNFFLARPQKTQRLLERIGEFSRNYGFFFEKERKILLYPVKVLRRKNITESLLVLNILNHIKDEWQLLITLEGTSKEEVEYAEKIKSFVKKKEMPVAIGFGYKLITGDESRVDSLNNIVDLFALSKAIITTSGQEGFGFTFLEGWIANRKVVGRKIPYIIKDLQSNGLKMQHFYSRINVNGSEFCEYSWKDKLKMLSKLDYDKIVKQKEIKMMIEFINGNHQDIIENNKKQILKHYSISSYKIRLLKILREADKLKKKTWKEPIIDNKELIEHFKKK